MDGNIECAEGAVHLPARSTVMVLVEGEPGRTRAHARLELESHLRQSELVVLDSRALGPARRELRDDDFEAARREGALWVLVLSMHLEGTTPRFELRLVATEGGGASRAWCSLEDVSMSSLQIEIFPDPGDSLSRPRVESNPDFTFGIPRRWNPLHGRGPEGRPLLRERGTGKWIDYDEAYLRMGRPDWQESYDRRAGGKLALLVAGTLVGVGGITTSVVFASDAQPAYVRSRLAALGWGLATASAGGLMIVTSAMIDPHPVGFEEVRDYVSGRSREPFDLQLHAGPAGAGAGFRAAF